jgi:tetraacyldisaccharide 4'-kinase
VRAHPLEVWLSRLWWQQPTRLAAWLLWPLSGVYRLLARWHRALAGKPAPTRVPVIVVGNLVAGGAGKTPIVIALVEALRAAGRRPAVVSRGHGRRGGAVRAVAIQSKASEVGDEPLLIHRRTRVPVFVGARRAEAAAALCAAHPEVDVIVSDDGLQHRALARIAEVVVFDDRGVGNGLLLPAGPLRHPLPKVMPPHAFVVYTGRSASTPLPGPVVPRHAERVMALEDWVAGAAGKSQPLASLHGRRLTALAGIGAPEQFFAMLEAAGLEIERLPCRDHADYAAVPWPPGTAEVITTEKDAVKLAALPPSGTQIWVLPLDCALPADWLRELFALLPATVTTAATTTTPTTASSATPFAPSTAAPPSPPHRPAR